MDHAALRGQDRGMAKTPLPAPDLFGDAPGPAPGTDAAARPLADRLRPRALAEVVGQADPRVAAARARLANLLY